MLIAAAQERAELRTDRVADQLATYFHYLYLGALMRWLTEPGINLRQEFDVVVTLFVDGAGEARSRTGWRVEQARNSHGTSADFSHNHQ